MNNEIDYKNSLKWTNSFQKFGMKLDLDRIRGVNCSLILRNLLLIVQAFNGLLVADE